MDEYDDDYATCEEAYATLRIFQAELDPDAVTRDLGIQPTKAFRRDEVTNPGARHPVLAKQGGWLLGTGGVITSRDIRRHLDWLIDQLGPRIEVLRRLQALGCRMDVFCYWRWTGQGGPTISPRNMAGLGKLGIELGFDVYYLPRKDETEEKP